MTKPNNIAALQYVSESDIYAVFWKSFAEMSQEEFHEVLWQFGLDYKKGYEQQDNIQHRNRQNKIVVCHRWVGGERLDDEWLNTGYASKEAKDKASGCKVLEDLYRSKCLTEDVQSSLEMKDKYTRKFEEQEEQKMIEKANKNKLKKGKQ